MTRRHLFHATGCHPSLVWYLRRLDTWLAGSAYVPAYAVIALVVIALAGGR